MNATREGDKLIVHQVMTKDRTKLMAMRAYFDAKSNTWSLAYNAKNLSMLQSINCSIPSYIFAGKTLQQYMRFRLRSVTIPKRITAGLFPYQAEALRYLEAGWSLLADEMGLGKTPVALRFAELHKDYRRVIVVVPAYLKEKWEYEARRWTTREVQIVNGTRQVTLIRSGIIIINYDILHFHMENLMKVKYLLIADEVHMCGNVGTKRTTALYKLSLNCDRPPIAMTGTPVLKDSLNLFPILNIIDSSQFYSRVLFIQRYCKQSRKRVVGSMNHAELYAKLRRSIMIRRTYDEVKSQFGSKYDVTNVLDIVPFALDNRKEYERADYDIGAYAKEQGLYYDFETLQLQKSRILKQISYQGKKKKVMEWLDNFLLSGEKITLFFMYTKHLEEFAEKYGAMIINGNTPINKRFGMVNEFNTNNQQVLCGNIKACGVGLDITGCHNCMFIDMDTIYDNMAQAYKRFSRYGQKAPFVNVWFAVGKNTIESQKILHTLDTRRNDAKQIIDGVSLKREEKMATLYLD